MKNTNKLLFIITALTFVILFAINLAIFYHVSERETAEEVSIGISWAAVGVLSFVIALHYTALSKINPLNKKIGYYFKNIWIMIILMALFSFGVSRVAGIAICFTLTLVRNSISGLPLNGAILTIPFFVIYIVGVYQTFIKLGFLDSQKQIFNLNFKVLTLFLILIFVMPTTVMANMYNTYYFPLNPWTDATVNVRSILSTDINLDLLDEFGVVQSNASVNIILVMIKVLLTLAIEMAITIFAYIRGKAIFVKQHLKRDRDYQTDEFMQVAKG